MKNVIFPRFIRMDGTAAGVRIPGLRRIFNTESLVNFTAGGAYGLMTALQPETQPATVAVAAGIATLSLTAMQAFAKTPRLAFFSAAENDFKYIDTRPPPLGAPTHSVDGLYANHTHHLYKRAAIRNACAMTGMLLLTQVARLTPLSHLDVNIISGGLALFAAASIAQYALPARRYYKIATGQWTLRPMPEELFTGKQLSLKPRI